MTNIPDHSKLLWHAKFARAYKMVNLLCLKLDPGLVILLTGPPGSGKTLITEMLEDLHEAPTIDEHLHDIKPVVRLRARGEQDKGYFSIGDLWFRALGKVESPMLGGSTSTRKLSTARMAHAFQQQLLSLRTRFLIIDEAQEIRQVQGGDKNARKILDALKSFAIEANVVLILAGGYPLLNTVALGAQLSRRTYHVVMHRYYTDRKGDRQEFVDIVKYCAHKRGVDFDTILEPNLAVLYDVSLGVFDMVDRALISLAAALEMRDAQRPGPDLVESILRKVIVPESIRAEIEDGEEFLRQSALAHVPAPKVRQRGQKVPKSKKKRSRRRSIKARDYTKDDVLK